MYHFNKIGIIGAGAYGVAIAQCFSSKIRQIMLIGNADSSLSSVNQIFAALTDSKSQLNENICCTDNFSTIKDCDLIFIATPAVAVADICEKIKTYGIYAPVILCSKGFDVKKGRLLSFLAEEILENEIAIFSGPSFAGEIAKGLPAAVNIAGKNKTLCCNITACLSSTVLEIKAIDDFISLQIAGAMKNILAIGCGVLSGLQQGENAIAKLIVLGLGEMIELATALGGQKETFLEFGGIGDVVLSCASGKSRNVLLGEYIAGGGKLSDWNGPLAEGAFAAQAIPLFAKNNNLQLGIFSEIYKILYPI
ncbi:MAG: NAD(P)H-dependent glycerol-3-phosphate dehydrogenase [Holosporaceae bacterium]|jgi:glycerol-3-phosphate dehydrogenase (NAD(P)+)|nr:NAD(P)H-dependent glycerol-3-phosphate dehydrogenase [Holosporaceae bacterium]